MTVSHPHHHPGHSHPSAHVAASLLRFSAWQRLALAAALSVVMWAVVYWAMQ
jgi:hypothetical protein